MGVFMAEVYMYIYTRQEKKEENQGPKIFVMRPIHPTRTDSASLVVLLALNCPTATATDA
jgi:hypothetical protein